MLFQKLALVSAFTALVAAQEIEQSDIPQQCTDVCQEVISIAQRCENENDDDDVARQCICSAPNAETILPECEACVAQNDSDSDDDDDHDNDVSDVLTRCNFNTAPQSTPANSAPASTTENTVVVTPTPTAAATGDDNDDDSDDDDVTSTAGQSEPSEFSGAAGPAQTAAVGLGALGLAMAMI